MNSSQELFNLIEDYVQGNLKGEQLAAFKKELKSNPALRKEVKLHQEMGQLLEEDSDESLFRSSLRMISDRFKKGNTTDDICDDIENPKE